MVISRMAKGAASGCGVTLLVLAIISLIGYVMVACGAPAWFAVAACGTTTFFAFIYARARLTNVGFRTIAVGDYRSARLYKHDCPRCTAGTQTLLTGTDGNVKGWGPIPKENRLYFTGTDHFHAPLGNIRRCNYCNGLGYRHLPFPPEIPYEATRADEEAQLNDAEVPVDELDLPEDI